jgi:hypothetical protein
VKYRGIFLQTEIYNRWLDAFEADGLLPVAEHPRHGLLRPGGVLSRAEEARGLRRTSQIFGDKDAGFDNSSEYLVGMNFYPFNTRNHRLNVQVHRREPVAGQQRVRLLRRRAERHELLGGVLGLLLGRDRERIMTSHVRPGRRVRRPPGLALASVAILAVIVAVAIPSARARGATGGAGTAAATAEQPLATTPQFHDSHFHLTNYIQEGITMQDFLGIMGTRVGRSTVFGIPLQQMWSYGNSGDFAPTYYLQTDAPLYYYSFTDAVYRHGVPLAAEGAAGALRPDDHRLQPGRHVRRRPHQARAAHVPGVFSGIGEFSIHKEFVSAKVAGETASLVNPALDRILDFAAEAGLVVILHNDIDMPFAKPDAEPVYLRQTKDLLKRHPKTTIIWAHTGLGRVVHPAEVTAHAAERSPRHVETLQAMLADPALAHIYFDISWDEVAKYAVSSPEAIERVAAMINRYPDRFLFGTDTVAPAGAEPYFRVFDLWTPVWKQLTPETSRKVRLGNYERLFDEARRRVRAWEAADAKR